MIPISATSLNHPEPWQIALRDAIREPAELLALLGLPDDALPALRAADADFRLLVPRGYAQRMRPGDPNDPLLLQILPQARELLEAPGYGDDPVGDLAAQITPGLLHKYHGRALLVTTGACAIHCRYCFRRHFPYAKANPARQDWQAALDYLRAHPEIEELILSGGDPLTLDDDRLAALAASLEGITHLRTLRLHTRLPSVLPERVNDRLLAWIQASRLHTVCVLHINHPNEIDAEVGGALARLRGAGVHLLNQSVLLRGVNDQAETLAALSRRLFEHGVLPYYLHQLDPVRGAAHFEVPAIRARHIMRALRARLPGYLVPRLVSEQAGHASKTPLD